VQKISDHGGTVPAQDWSYNAGTTVSGGPVVFNRNIGPVYFGTNGTPGKYVALKDGDGTLWSANWPYSAGLSGNASVSPWVDINLNRVFFGTSGGNLDAFPVE